MLASASWSFCLSMGSLGLFFPTCRGERHRKETEEGSRQKGCVRLTAPKHDGPRTAGTSSPPGTRSEDASGWRRREKRFFAEIGVNNSPDPNKSSVRGRSEAGERRDQREGRVPNERWHEAAPISCLSVSAGKPPRRVPRGIFCLERYSVAEENSVPAP